MAVEEKVCVSKIGNTSVFGGESMTFDEAFEKFRNPSIEDLKDLTYGIEITTENGKHIANGIICFDGENLENSNEKLQVALFDQDGKATVFDMDNVNTKDIYELTETNLAEFENEKAEKEIEEENERD